METCVLLLVGYVMNAECEDTLVDLQYAEVEPDHKANGESIIEAGVNFGNPGEEFQSMVFHGVNEKATLKPLRNGTKHYISAIAERVAYWTIFKGGHFNYELFHRMITQICPEIPKRPWNTTKWRSLGWMLAGPGIPRRRAEARAGAGGASASPGGTATSSGSAPASPGGSHVTPGSSPTSTSGRNKRRPRWYVTPPSVSTMYERSESTRRTVPLTFQYSFLLTAVIGSQVFMIGITLAYRQKCCGVDNFTDFQHSHQFQKTRLSIQVVPPSCCILQMDKYPPFIEPADTAAVGGSGRSKKSQEAEVSVAAASIVLEEHERRSKKRKKKKGSSCEPHPFPSQNHGEAVSFLPMHCSPDIPPHAPPPSYYSFPN
eukprot:maker-scaffold127_size327531-snap-gene-1.6 protein:Tk07874 transcript:maker-scaffold127_size327531-snap-gene-1.6-mRNA-1 annotation:"PREDICTED: tetraspanin-1-like"